MRDDGRGTLCHRSQISATHYFVAPTSNFAIEIADKLGVSQAATVGAVANEYDTRYNYDLLFTTSGSVAQNVADRWVSGEPWIFKQTWNRRGDSVTAWYCVVWQAESGEMLRARPSET